MNRLDALNLFTDGTIELSYIERNGIRIDVPLLHETKDWVSRQIEKKEKLLKETDEWAEWVDEFGTKANLHSNEQMARVFYDLLGHEPTGRTPSGKPSTNAESLSKIKSPFIKAYSEIQKLEKVSKTYLRGIERHLVGDRLRPSFSLGIPVTYRSSSQYPNFQNFPGRDDEQAKLIRPLFIASDGHFLSENDFKGIEVSVAATYHKDPKFIEDITGGDMHRDMAAELFILDKDQVSKKARYHAKNAFVFAQFYGQWYFANALNLWEAMKAGGVEGPNGSDIFEHLRSNGITALGSQNSKDDTKPGTFIHHVKEIENRFWNKRYKVYNKWRKEFLNKYHEFGWFKMHTGFKVFGDWERNQVINSPIQGAAFHCLLFVLIDVNRKMRARRMRSMIVGQIHDSIISDVAEDEANEFFEMLDESVAVDLPKAFEWLNVPMTIEYEVCPPTGSWYEKQEMEYKDGVYMMDGHASRDAVEILDYLEEKK